MINRQRTRALGHQVQQDRDPGAVSRVGIRVYEQLDGHAHGQQCQRREPGGQAQQDQHRENMLAEGGSVSSHRPGPPSTAWVASALARRAAVGRTARLGLPVDPEVRDHDPDLALYGGGPDGLDLPRTVIAAAARLLRPGGLLVVEHAEVQAAAARAATPAGLFDDVRTAPDLTGRPRTLLARRALPATSAGRDVPDSPA